MYYFVRSLLGKMQTISIGLSTSGGFRWCGALGQLGPVENYGALLKPALDAGSNNFSGLGGRIYVKYISLNGGSGTSEDPYTFNDSGTPTDYKQITVKVGIPGTTDSTQIDAIKSAKVDQGYGLTFSPYGL